MHPPSRLCDAREPFRPKTAKAAPVCWDSRRRASARRSSHLGRAPDFGSRHLPGPTGAGAGSCPKAAKAPAVRRRQQKRTSAQRSPDRGRAAEFGPRHASGPAGAKAGICPKAAEAHAIRHRHCWRASARRPPRRGRAPNAGPRRPFSPANTGMGFVQKRRNKSTTRLPIRPCHTRDGHLSESDKQRSQPRIVLVGTERSEAQTSNKGTTGPDGNAAKGQALDGEGRQHHYSHDCCAAQISGLAAPGRRWSAG